MKTLSQVICNQDTDHIDFLKIETEAAEKDVLAGLSEKHWRTICQVVIEARHSHIEAE